MTIVLYHSAAINNLCFRDGEDGLFLKKIIMVAFIWDAGMTLSEIWIPLNQTLFVLDTIRTTWISKTCTIFKF